MLNIGRINSSCSTNDTCCVTFATHSVIGYEGGKEDGIVTRTTYWWARLTHKLFEENAEHEEQ